MAVIDRQVCLPPENPAHLPVPKLKNGEKQMTSKSIDERKADLAAALQQAASQPQTPQGAAGAFGIPNFWGLVASHLIEAIEAIVQDAINQSKKP